MVSIILGSLAEGMSPNEIIEQYPQLSAKDVAAAVAYGRDREGRRARR